MFTNKNSNILIDQLIEEMESEMENVTTNGQLHTGAVCKGKQSTSSASQPSIGINDNTHTEYMDMDNNNMGNESNTL